MARLLASLLVAGAAAADDPATVVGSSRSCVVDAFLIDSVWDDAVQHDDAAATSEQDVFEEDLTAAVSGVYQHCDANSIHESDIWIGGINAEFQTSAAGANFDFVNVPVESEGTAELAVTLHVDTFARFLIWYEAETEVTAAFGVASVDLAVGDVFLSSITGNDQAEIDSFGLLGPGEHTISLTSRAFVDAVTDADPYAPFESASSYAYLDVRLYKAPDINTDGVVDIDDLLTILLSWGTCGPEPCAADVNASGAVDADDLVAAILAWG